MPELRRYLVESGKTSRPDKEPLLYEERLDKLRESKDARNTRILFLKRDGYSVKKIAEFMQCSRTTVSNVLKLAREEAMIQASDAQETPKVCVVCKSEFQTMRELIAHWQANALCWDYIEKEEKEWKTRSSHNK